MLFTNIKANLVIFDLVQLAFSLDDSSTDSSTGL